MFHGSTSYLFYAMSYLNQQTTRGVQFHLYIGGRKMVMAEGNMGSVDLLWIYFICKPNGRRPQLT